MKNTFYGPLDNPSLAVGINTTGTDIEQFLAGAFVKVPQPFSCVHASKRHLT